MQMISELMTRDVRFVAPQENLQRAAQLMDELNVGALPVCDDGRLVGMVTDRDITIRATAAGRSPQEAHVDEVMSTDVRWCFEDQSLDDVMIQMADSQIRRVPVVTHDDQHRLVGIVSLGDVATRTPAGAQKEDVEQVVEMVSSPSQPGRPQAPVEEAAGRSGAVSAEAAAGTPRDAGTDVPHAGDTGGSLGYGVAAGASGDPRTAADGANTGGASGNTGDPRRNFGVSGQDLNQDGLPPA
ncbi:MAG TPA: CBS domain-containing protein [Noviherbaspirillum sp.]|uniref:CBS domain-containing protein n=1 Tax=Noviherbaspirillum sp. TaxID=1926288 RepID=UPI002D5C5908|nr:CBS domain-containing protein [Noviherbaspirillum sp.]HYD93812.1 CBS domain-containing protein [Noviherbaspirillum sp.]